MANPAILITGGTGFLGSALTEVLLKQGYSVHIFSRDAEKVRARFGDRVAPVVALTDLPDAGEFRAIVNLAGAGILDRRWSQDRKRELRDSRIGPTRQLADWINASTRPPGVLISGSAIGIYGDQGERPLEETSPPKPDFAQQLCADWEAAAIVAGSSGCRVCLLRTGLVLGNGGGLLQRLLPVYRLGLGGTIGDGRQWMSWIHLTDWLAIVETLMNDSNMVGPYNATAPTPVDNRQFSQALARTLGRPMLLPLPAWLLRPILGEMAELLLGGQRVLPTRLSNHGFGFRYPRLDDALNQLLLRH
ncbi:TIGR01777 family oxidoreductase [Methylomonas sp. UP202]|uniref:TIGR01777 family oxidoreductase n=1 Tax=Methylomonas sp. UP202 TaxID=3040943 RepID=UPI00143C2E97|nr:TIGR01777 family oxidoreductase [Methylomonas sp. UP202]NJA04877.1 TIGR01777 family protein [Methylococcaceae bacterium WWC4]WGS87765.1 TIGR01777 family oxidoreductase [Methylomonas sp. UP202]